MYIQLHIHCENPRLRMLTNYAKLMRRYFLNIFVQANPLPRACASWQAAGSTYSNLAPSIQLCQVPFNPKHHQPQLQSECCWSCWTPERVLCSTQRQICNKWQQNTITVFYNNSLLLQDIVYLSLLWRHRPSLEDLRVKFSSRLFRNLSVDWL